jgi:hypothetical protein
MLKTKYLIINCETGDARTVSRTPRDLTFGEIAYRLKINVPDTWGKILGDIELSLPEPPDDVGVTEVAPYDP